MGLENQTNDEFITYKQLGKDLRNMINEELKRGSYDHLTNPNNKKGVKIPATLDQLAEIKCRFSIMPRKEFRKGLGRNTNLGRNEIILAIYGQFAKEEEPEEGFIPNAQYKARFMIGENFIDKSVETIVAHNAGQYFNLLREGDYSSFVKEMMTLINQAVDLYKNYILDDYEK